jgi:signal transduction histidine kinase
MITSAERPTERFVTKGTSVACVAATAAGLIKAAVAGGEHSSASRLALVVALGSVYALLGTVGLYLVERRGTKVHRYLLLAAMFAAGAVAVVVSRGAAFLLLMPLVSYGVLFLSPGGAAVLVVACSALTLTTWGLQASSTAELVRDLAIWISALAFVLVISRMVLLQHRARAEVEGLAQKLTEANEQLRAQAADVEELAKAKERNRIARDIHDGLGHYLTVVHVQIEAAQVLLARDPETARAALLRAQEMTREGLADVRRSVALLRGSPPAQRPLLAAIEKLASECKADGIEAALKLSGTPRPLPEPVEITLYRAAQEALTNVRRHSRASRLTIELAFAASDGIRLRVEDDGVGADQFSHGFGLLGLRERAESVGGKLSVRSTRGRGFTLEMDLPG